MLTWGVAQHAAEGALLVGLRVAQLVQGSSCARRVPPYRYGSSQRVWGHCGLSDACCRLLKG
jgi:hypothetical protein